MMYVSAFFGSQTKMSFREKGEPGPTPCPLSFSESQIRVEGTQKGTKGWVSEMGAACQAWRRAMPGEVSAAVLMMER